MWILALGAFATQKERVNNAHMKQARIASSRSFKKRRVAKLSRLENRGITEKRRDIAHDTICKALGHPFRISLSKSDIQQLVDLCEEMWELVVASDAFKCNTQCYNYKYHCLVVLYRYEAYCPLHQ